MVRFGGNVFTGFSVPLVFEGRYFVMEPGNPPNITVFSERNGLPIFEVLKNEPIPNDVTDVTKTAAGIITVSQKGGPFLYKVRPDSESSIAFGTLRGEEVTARITDTRIQVGGITLENNCFNGNMAGVVVRPDGGADIGAPIPQLVLQWLTSR
jgi:hypothetical protein